MPLKQPRQIAMDLVDAQQARRGLDRLGIHAYSLEKGQKTKNVASN